MSLSVAFFGSGSFAEPIVALLRARGVLRCLVTQDETAFWEKRVGGGVSVWRGLDDGLYRSLRGEEGGQEGNEAGGKGGGKGGVDVILTASYGARLGAEVLACARLGSYNVHASLLPRWRGASPIQRAILHGDTSSGVSVIRMSDRIDCGDIVVRKRVLLSGDETYDSLGSRLSALGAEATSELLEGLSGGGVCGEVQEEEGVCWASKLRREEGLLDWRAPAERLERQVRAFLRWPGSFFVVRGERIVVHASRVESGVESGGESGKELGMGVGSVLREHPYPIIACGGGGLGLLRLQRAGRRVLDAESFLRGFRLERGMSL